MPTVQPLNFVYDGHISDNYFCSYKRCSLNSLGPSDAIWRQRPGSPLAQVMACCLTAPIHYLDQCWFIMDLMLWHPPENNFIGIFQNINSINEFENNNFKIITVSPKGQWVNPPCWMDSVAAHLSAPTISMRPCVNKLQQTLIHNDIRRWLLMMQLGWIRSHIYHQCP